MISGWPPGHYDLPLGTKVYLDFGSASGSVELLRKARTGSDLRHCNLRSPLYDYLDGRWIFIGEDLSSVWHSWDDLSNKVVGGGEKGYLLPRKDDDRGADIRTWTASNQYVWQPRMCKLAGFHPKAAKDCIQGKIVHFRGDSHMRRLWNTVLAFVCGPKAPLKGWKGNKCATVEPCTGICIFSDAIGNSTCDLKADLTIANIGQHPADGRHHWKYKQYTSLIDDYIQRLQRLDDYKTKFVWHQTNAAKFRKDSWIRSYKDWRTNGRIGMYNRYTREVFGRLGVPIIDSYIQTKPFNRHERDSAHYTDPVL